MNRFAAFHLSQYTNTREPQSAKPLRANQRLIA